MDLLVLDTIHGGDLLADELALRGHRVTAVDVYRGTKRPPDPGDFDRVIAPVHLDPSHPLVSADGDRLVTHHEAAGYCLRHIRPRLLVEVTGARGKTTTAFAIAETMEGPGVLHTSAGTFLYPQRRLLWRRSITPASVLPAARAAAVLGGWCVAEVSIGVTGAGDLAVLTSGDDYPCAAGARSALACKIASAARAPRLLVADGLSIDHPGLVLAGELAPGDGEAPAGRRGAVGNPLTALPAYRNAVQIASAAAGLLGLDPLRLVTMGPVPGRLEARREGGRTVVDDANSGTTRATACEAASYARFLSPGEPLALVVGEEHRAVCEGFPPGDVAEAVASIDPAAAVIVGPPSLRAQARAALASRGWHGQLLEAGTLDGGRATALGAVPSGPVVLAVKTWR
ncbi:MAG: coenzyme F430 synthase [Methanospirillum sp.]|nr:coenzyme F430 synthase [Methanospirillum sp.]